MVYLKWSRSPSWVTIIIAIGICSFTFFIWGKNICKIFTRFLCCHSSTSLAHYFFLVSLFGRICTFTLSITTLISRQMGGSLSTVYLFFILPVQTDIHFFPRFRSSYSHKYLFCFRSCSDNLSKPKASVRRDSSVTQRVSSEASVRHRTSDFSRREKARWTATPGGKTSWRQNAVTLSLKFFT